MQEWIEELETSSFLHLLPCYGCMSPTARNRKGSGIFGEFDLHHDNGKRSGPLHEEPCRVTLLVGHWSLSDPFLPLAAQDSAIENTQQVEFSAVGSVR